MLTVFCCDLWQSELQCQICIRICDFDVAPVYVCRRAERQFQLRWLACVRDRMHGLADDSRSQHVFMAVHAPDSYKLRDATNVRSGYVAAVLAVRASPSVTVKLWPCGCLQSGLCSTWICRHGRSFPSMGLWLLRMIIASGGGILVGGSSSLSFVAHAGPVVVALNAAALSGGGVAATFGSTVSSKGSPAAVDFQNCFAPTGGCMHSDAAHLDISNASFTDCAASDAAGAVYASGTPPGSHCTGCSFSQNSVNSAAGAGSAVYAVGEASMLLSECTLTDNIAGLHGGAVAAEGAATRVDMHGCSFAGNAVSDTAGSGGHVFAGAGVFMSVTGGTTFAGGVARSGGAIACEVDAIVTLDGAVFTGNTATLQGGAMWVSGAGVHCSQCQFTANRVSEGTTTTVVSPQLVTAVPGFSSHTLGGGAVYVVHEAAWSRDTRLSDCTFAQNVAPYGGAVRFDGWADDTSCSAPPGACDGNVAYLRFEGTTGLSDNKVAFQGVDIMWSHTPPHNLPVNAAPDVASLPRVLDVAGSALQALPGRVLAIPMLVTVKDACVHQ